MGLRSNLKNFVAVQFFAKEVKALESRATEAKRSLATIQHLDIITNSGTAGRNGYLGNEYDSYDSQVREMDEKYRGVAQWGNQILANIVDVRSAFTIGQGIKVRLKKGKETKTRELKFVEELMELQDLDQEVPQDWATEAELEGKFLCRLFPNNDTRSIDLRFIPWISQNYTIKTPDDDYMSYEEVIYNLNGKGTEQHVPYDEFVYKKFGGRKHVVNEASPKIGKVLTAIENLDKALWDWRKINHYHASPTPYFKCADVESAKAMQAQITAINWKIGKALAGTGDFSIQSLQGSGIADILDREIQTNAKVISAAVSLPIHFLGFADLMSNRSTSTDLFELIQAGTGRERKIWIGFYEELFKKALQMANQYFNYNFDVDAISVDIPFVSAEKMKQLTEIWLPLYAAGTLSLQTFLSKVPEVDAAEEMELLEEAQERALEATRAIADDDEELPENIIADEEDEEEEEDVPARPTRAAA